MNLKIFVISLTAGILLLTGYYAGWDYLKTAPDPVFCTQDAMQCPDGTFVGRTGPKCEFKKCPEVASSIILNLPAELDWSVQNEAEYDNYLKADGDFTLKNRKNISLHGKRAIAVVDDRAKENKIPVNVDGFFREQFIKWGWQEDLGNDADGPTGGVFGYFNGDKHILVSTNIEYFGQDSPEGPAQCPCKTNYSVFWDDPGISIESKSDTSSWKTYRIDEDGYSISLPRGWSMPNIGNFYGPGADLPSISVIYYAGLKDIPLNEVTGKPYVSFEQYAASQNLFKDQNIYSYNFGNAIKATSAEDPFYKVLLIKGNNHFYEIIYAARYNQTLSLLDQILSTFKFIDTSGSGGDIKKTGVAFGKITVGPLCPVEPCSSTTNPFLDKKLVFTKAGGGETFYADISPEGIYWINLPAADYTVTFSDCRYMGCPQVFPRSIRIEEEDSVKLDIDIDTGIR